MNDERPNVAIPDVDHESNHDLMYAYSDDRGRTWQNNAGQTIACSGQSPIRVDSPGIVVAPIKGTDLEYYEQDRGGHGERAVGRMARDLHVGSRLRGRTAR
jgi:hypothetical protein